MSAGSADRRGRRSNLGPQLSALLGNRACDCRALHLALVVDDHTCIVLKIHKHTIDAPPRLLLADNHCLENLLAQLGLAFLHRGQHHIAWSTAGHLVQPATNASNCHDVEVLCAAVVRAVHKRCDAHTCRDLQLCSAACTSALHLSLL